MSVLVMTGSALALLLGWSPAPDDHHPPTPVATTRWSLKETLEAQKFAKPRLTPPPMTADEKARGSGNAGQNSMRRLLDPEVRAVWPRDWLDDNMPLTRRMRNELLWITSRVNNCLY